LRRNIDRNTGNKDSEDMVAVWLDKRDKVLAALVFADYRTRGN
jgi:hypothetical protein